MIGIYHVERSYCLMASLLIHTGLLPWLNFRGHFKNMQLNIHWIKEYI
jgi:hypothetical protein